MIKFLKSQDINSIVRRGEISSCVNFVQELWLHELLFGSLTKNLLSLGSCQNIIYSILCFVTPPNPGVVGASPHAMQI